MLIPCRDISTEKAKLITEWIKKYVGYLEDDNTAKEKRYDKLKSRYSYTGVSAFLI